MTRPGVIDPRFPGRVTLGVVLPDDLLRQVERLATERGVDRAMLLGDLVAEALPDALAEVARDLLDSPNAETPPEGGVSRPILTRSNPGGILPPGDPEREPGGGAAA